MIKFNWKPTAQGNSWLILIVVLAAFLFSVFNWGLPWRFNSPDEAANAFFATRLARGEFITAPVPLNEITQNPIVHPRSTNIINGQLAPASFLGLPLILGWVGGVVGTQALPYLTPLGAIFGLLALFGIVRELTTGNKPAAWLASLLLMLTPAFWYYHSRSFFHNALFLDFLLAAIYVALLALKKKNSWLYLVSGLIFGFALALRTSEIFWLAAAGIAWFGINWPQWKWRDLALVILGMIAAFSPVLITNYNIYGSVFSVGYRQELVLTNDLEKTLGLVQQLVLPFGFHPSVIFKTVSNYLVNLTWWWTVLVGVGIIYFVKTWRQQSRQAKAFMISIFVMCLWLATVYGSWQFNDNPDPEAVTLGTSYVRYWLPIYALLLWPAGVVLSKLLNWRWGKELILLVIGSYALLSGLLVWTEPQEGLAAVRGNIMKFQSWSVEVQEITEPNSVIVSGLTDKIFWPERQVIYTLVNPVDYESVNKLLHTGIPVYWFHPTWQAADLVTMNNRLSVYGLSISAVKLGWQDFSLYKFSLTP